MFDFLKLLGSLFLILFLGLYLLMVMAFHVDSDLAMGVSAVVAAIISIVASTMLKASDTKCPKCGKAFGMKEISRKTVGRHATTVDVERKVKNSKGEVVRTYTEAVPATQYFYDCVDECKFCGHRRDVQRNETVRD